MWPEKSIILGIFTVPAALFLALGTWCRGPSTLQRDLGIVFLSVGGMGAFVILVFVCMLNTPDAAKGLPPDFLVQFGAFKTGFGFLATYIVLGALLLFFGSKKEHG